ncbi:penicillin-binding protein 1C [Zhouia sp. PK063]|uniref:penicillin-binding protein 1C n=1 Tax=Zhouia sp. PK063 TaxID=3373602 RepID=UPI00379FF500
MGRFVAYVKRHKIKLSIAVVALVGYYFCLPEPLFHAPMATVIESNDGQLLAAKIASDGQWRFPVVDSVPVKFAKCITYFEDEYFYTHPGFNPVAMTKALYANIKAGKVVRGGSTITQQVIRLSRKGKHRTYAEKLIELILATRLEFRYSKASILKYYASYAPFGGNVVGLDVAAWRYFGVKPEQLSWAESATLAVLPNAPSLIYPGKNQLELLRKRNDLLKKLYEHQEIDETTYQLSLQESLPQKPFALPQVAPHLLQYVAKKKLGKRIKTTIDYHLQQQANTVVQHHYQVLKQNGVYNAAVLVMNVHTRQVIAYVGNTPTDKAHQKDVDIIHAPRSTGSVIKPLLYAAMMDAGELLPTTLVPDVPTQIAGYSPQNFDLNYDGAVPANRALARSLNVPAVRLLQRYGLEKFRDQLKAFHLRDINKSADYYGLTLILGGAESNLWDLCKTYASLSSTVNHFNETSSEYYKKEFTEPVLYADTPADFGEKSIHKTVFDAGSIYETFNAMQEVNRPDGDEAWQYFDSSRKIAWKTGTSFGNRDAWAIGVTKDYVVGVWTGNADGEGRPNMTGVSSAAPIMFDVFNMLPRSTWFTMPYDEMVQVEVCKKSGYLATDLCEKEVMWVPKAGARFKSCPYHQLVHLDAQKQFRVNTSCEDVGAIVNTSWFVLPPLMAYYYKNTDASYSALPPFRSDCAATTTSESMQFIYPKQDGEVVLPKDFNGKTNDLILKIAHDKPETTIFWYVDDTFIKATTNFHEIAIQPAEGKHVITALDENGTEIHRTIFIQKTH